MDHYEFYKELYFKENDRRTEIENSLNIPFAIITALVAGIYILATTFRYSEAGIWETYCFAGFMIGTVLTLAGAVFFIILVYGDAGGIRHIFNPNNTFSYQGIPYSQSLFNWHANLVIFYTGNPPPANSAGVPTAVQQADADLKEYLLNQFVVTTNHNTFVNDRKLTDIYRAKKLLIISLFFNFLALFPYMYGFVTKKDEVHKVELQNKIHKIEVSSLDSLKVVFPTKKSKNMEKSKKDGKYFQVDPKHRDVRTDSSGRPCPPTTRVIKEGRYPEKPLDYKK